MALETKVILKLLANTIIKSSSIEEAYIAVAEAANVEGVALPSYEDAMKALNDVRKKNMQ